MGRSRIQSVPEPSPFSRLGFLDHAHGPDPGGHTLFLDACASLWLKGECVHLKDLVLDDRGMDQRAPTRGLTRAHAVFQAKCRIAAGGPGRASNTISG
jgi:geranylgeranyl pyrophosphate synthase